MQVGSAPSRTNYAVDVAALCVRVRVCPYVHVCNCVLTFVDLFMNWKMFILVALFGIVVTGQSVL